MTLAGDRAQTAAGRGAPSSGPSAANARRECLPRPPGADASRIDRPAPSRASERLDALAEVARSRPCRRGAGRPRGGPRARTSAWCICACEAHSRAAALEVLQPAHDMEGLSVKLKRGRCTVGWRWRGWAPRDCTAALLGAEAGRATARRSSAPPIDRLTMSWSPRAKHSPNSRGNCAGRHRGAFTALHHVASAQNRGPSGRVKAGGTQGLERSAEHPPVQ